MKKRLLSLLCVVCLLLTALPTGAFAVEGEETLPASQAAEGGETKEKTPPDDRTDGEDGGQAPLVRAMTVTEFVTLDPDELNGISDAELLEGYLYSVSGLYGGASLFRAPARPLEGLLKDVKAQLEGKIKEVAAGTLASTEFTFLNSWEKSKTEWGIEAGDQVIDGSTLTKTAETAIKSKLNLSALIQRLLSEMPYELYWYDKTKGASMSYGVETSGENVTVKDLTISMNVSQNYAAGASVGTYNPLMADTTKTKAVADTPKKAQAVVDTHKSESDYDKLVAYLDYIKEEVSYDTAAVTPGKPYGDPWQLIYVFDGKNDTNVVCEGYAKAFQYLCDLTANAGGFKDTSISSALVTGEMSGGTGAGGHMWNVVTIGSANYLVDVTNCDEGTVGAPNKLFLCGVTEDTPNEKYTATVGSTNIVYVYDKDTLENYNAEDLKLSDSAYKPLAVLTGSVTISGDAKINVKLTATPSGLPTDAGALTYKWYRDGETTPISGANTDTYIPSVAADVGKKIKVVVTAANYSGSVTSATTDTVEKADGPAMPTGLAEVSRTDTTITVTPNAAWEYSRDGGSTWQDSNVFTGLTANTTYSQIVARVKETGTHKASDLSPALTVSTKGLTPDSETMKKLRASHEPHTGEYDGKEHPAFTSGLFPTSGWQATYRGYGTTIPTVKDVTDSGNYDVHFQHAGYEDVDLSYEVKISPKDIKPTVSLSPTSFTYDGTAKTPTVTVKDGETVLELGTDYTVSGGTTGTDAGDYTITVTCTGNYTGSNTANWKITKATPVVGDFNVHTLASPIPYNGQPVSVTVPTFKNEGGKTGMGNVTVKYNGDTTAPRYVGEYSLTFSVTEGKNYKATTSDLNFGTMKIVAVNQTPKITPTARLSTGGKTLDLTSLLSDYKGKPTFALDATTSATLDSDGKTLITTDTAGTVKITVNIPAVDKGGDSTPEYNAYTSTDPITVTVSNKPIDTNRTMTITQKGCTYGETLPNYELISASIYQGTTTVHYNGTLKDGTTYSSDTAPTKAGDYTVKVTYETETNIHEATADFTISPRTVTITGVTAKDKVYDGTNTATVKTDNAIFNGILEGDALSITATGTFADANAGDNKTVTLSLGALSGADMANYTLATTGNQSTTTASITKATLLLTSPSGLTTTYGDKLSSITLTNPSDNVPGTWSWMDDTQSVGDASDTAKDFKARFTPDDTTNYATQEGLLVSVTVNKAAPSAPTGLFGIKGQALSTVTLPNGWTWVDGTTRMGTEGNQTFTANYVGDTNHNSESDVSLTVNVKNKSDVSGSITFNDGTLTYNGAGQNYEMATISGISASGTAKWTYTYAVSGTGTLDSGLPKTVGTYTVTARYEDDANIGTKSATLTITAKKIAAPAADATVYTYTGGAQTYKIAASADYTVSGGTQTNANESGYTVTVALTDKANTAWTDGTTADKTYSFKIMKAAPTGTPTYTAINASGKTLADAALAVGGITPAGGTITWDMATTTLVAANTAYGWTYTPTDTANYNKLTGSITLYVVAAPPSGGGSSSGGSSSDGSSSGSGTVKTETTKNDDGSTTRTETKKDGTVIETTTGKDGSVSKAETKTETKKDGTKVETRAETVTNKDGSKSTSKTEITTAKDGTVTESKSETRTGADGTKSVTKAESKTDKNGATSGTETTTTTAPNGSTGTTTTTTENGSSRTEAETTLSSKAVEEAKRNGEPVKAPVEVEAARNSDSAPTVKIELPKSAGDTKVEIPVTNVKPGTVAVIVHPDGTEEIIKDSIPTENGVQLTVSGGATVKIMDNSKDFGDIQSHWAKDAIDFVSARGLVNGINPTLYSPNASATRAQLWTILARQADAELNGGANWYEKAQNWAKDKGISDGADPNGTINRAQMVTMLWRAMGEPVSEITHSFTDIAADNYYAQAVAWAVRNGITTGVGDGRFDPNGACTRGQIAAFLMRYCSAK